MTRRWLPRRITPSTRVMDGDYLAGMWDGSERSHGWVLPRGLHWLGRMTRRWWSKP